MNQIAVTNAHQYLPATLSASTLSSRTPLLLLVTDDDALEAQIRSVCAFLDIEMMHLDSSTRLLPLLRALTPMAVIADVDTQSQDGFHVMKVVGTHDQSLPLLLLSGTDQIIAGAADAVEQLWALTAVRRTSCMPCAGEIVEFLCDAGRHGDCLGLMPV